MMSWTESRFTKKYLRIVLIWCILMAVIGAIYAFVVLPVRKQVSMNTAKVTAKNSEAQKISEYVSQENINRLKKSHKQLADRLGTFVSNAEMINESIYAISSIAEQIGVTDFTTRQRSFSGFEPIENCTLLAAANVEIKCRGSYCQFLRLVNAYERFRPVILVDRFSFSSDGSKSLLIKMSLTILVDNRSGNLI